MFRIQFRGQNRGPRQPMSILEMQIENESGDYLKPCVGDASSNRSRSPLHRSDDVGGGVGSWVGVVMLRRRRGAGVVPGEVAIGHDGGGSADPRPHPRIRAGGAVVGGGGAVRE